MYMFIFVGLFPKFCTCTSDAQKPSVAVAASTRREGTGSNMLITCVDLLQNLNLKNVDDIDPGLTGTYLCSSKAFRSYIVKSALSPALLRVLLHVLFQYGNRGRYPTNETESGEICARSRLQSKKCSKCYIVAMAVIFGNFTVSSLIESY